MPYCYAHFITEGIGMKKSINIYKQEFRPNNLLKKPKVNVCIWALTSNDDESAKLLYSSRACWKIERSFSKLGTLKEPREALNNIISNNWKKEFDLMFNNSFVGSKQKVKGKLVKLKNEIDFDELTLLTWCYDEGERRNSYKLFQKCLINIEE